MKVLVVDDHELFRKAFIRLLKFSIEYPVSCDEAQNGFEAIDKLQNEKFDLMFLDVSMPRMDGIETCKRLKSAFINVPVIVLTQFDNENLIFHFYKLGVQSFLTKGASVEELKEAVESAVSFRKYFPLEVNLIIQRMTGNQNQGSQQRIDLTCQEKLLLQYLKGGLTSKEIAEKMNLTDKTVRTYKERIMEKTNTRNVAELISFGFKNGILS